MHQFHATIEKVGVNPFVLVPEDILEAIFQKAGKEKGPIPIKGTVNGKPYRQTLVKYLGIWRLYINLSMLAKSPERIGECIHITVDLDTETRDVVPHPDWVRALRKNKAARQIFDQLTPSRQKEITRYIASLKTAESVQRNIDKAIAHLLGENSFAGRVKP